MAADKKAKAVVEAILKSKGEDYDNWLNKKHLEYIMENCDTFLAAMNIEKEKD